MPRGRPEYPAEFRRQMVELVRSGRSAGDLAQEFEPTAKSIRNWVREAEAAQSGAGESLTTAERQELLRLRRENRRLREEREILAKAAAWFARETESIPPKDSDS
jgi:transposase